MKRTLIITFFLTIFFLLPTFHTSTTATPIKHVIIIIEENHSFDNMFGTYPFGWPPIVNNITLSVMWPCGLYKNYTQLESSKNGELCWISVPNVPWLPFLGSSHPYYANAWDTVDPGEGWCLYHGDYWFDTYDGFVYYSGPQSMAYFSYQQVGILWDYAEEYVLADNYYSPVLGLTEPNRVAYMTGFPPSFYSDDACNVIPFNETIMYQLCENNISWGYFVYDYSGCIPWPMGAFIGIQNYMNHFHGLTAFQEYLQNNSLPAVSWVMLINGYDDRYDMHPPYNVTAGAVEISQIINEIMRSPEWNSTVIFITFDEGGGYFDQIVPPAINHYGLGQRIPLLIISPYAKEAWIDNYTLSGYTLLGFIDYNWHLPWLTKCVENSDVQGLLCAFNFSKYRPPIILCPNNWTYPIPLQYPVHYGYIAIVHPLPGYTSVYSEPAIQILLPLDLIGFALLFASFKKRNLTLYALLSLLVSLGISGFVYSTNSIYSFVTDYFVYSSLIGFLISSVLALKRYKNVLRR
ncbi:MAG: alkaline phosphatase family protein [Acidianus sp.]|uniref:phospholipase C n=1 Tax=Acidianus sp. TaxID=1872104 RepID=UPI00397D09AC